jgi:phage FluMu protein Com
MCDTLSLHDALPICWTFNEIKNHYEEETAAIERKSTTGKGKQTVINSDGTIKTPELLQKAANTKKPIKYG